MKYKIGEKVRVKKDLIVGRPYKMEDSGIGDTFVSSMESFKGRVVTISSTFGSKYRINESPFWWTDEMFEPIQKTESIIIYREGPKVIALDKNTGNKGTAKCSPEDTFDFYEGAELAFKRLKAKAFKLGDILVALPHTPYVITNNGWVGKVVELKDNGYITLQGLDMDKNRLISFDCLEPEYFRLAKDEDLTPELLRKIWTYAV